MNAIILAAGIGKRLGNLTRRQPKALVTLAGRALIGCTIDMTRFMGASKVIIVGGSGYSCLKRFVESYAPEAILEQNVNFQRGNLYSLRCAFPFIDDGFLLLNVDHVFSKDLLQVVFTKCRNADVITVFCDHTKAIQEDQMKVRVEGTKLRMISKDIMVFDTGYIGLTYCPSSMVDAYFHTAEEVANEKGDDAIAENVLNSLVKKKQRIEIVDVGGFAWFEVDTPNDLNEAERLLTCFPNKWA